MRCRLTALILSAPLAGPVPAGEQAPPFFAGATLPPQLCAGGLVSPPPGFAAAFMPAGQETDTCPGPVYHQTGPVWRF